MNYLNEFRNKVRATGLLRTLWYTLSALWMYAVARPWYRHVRRSFSQRQEDLILDRLLDHAKHGYYVDIGANDPVHLSNSFHFYLKNNGWEGLAIEPDPRKCATFATVRPRDTILNIGIGEREQIMPFYRFAEDKISTFSKKQAEASVALGKKLVDTIKIRCRPLKTVLAELNCRQRIDFMSVDTEGFDLQVLESNDWKKYRPRLIVVESDAPEIEAFLAKRQYELVARTVLFGNRLNSIHRDMKQAD